MQGLRFCAASVECGGDARGMAVLQKILDVLPLNEETAPLPARAREPARPLHAGRPARIPLPGARHVARRHGDHRPGERQGGRARGRLYRSCRPARRHDHPRSAERLCDVDRRDAAQARQARRAAHLARQPPDPRPAGRPPPRPHRAAQSALHHDPAGRHRRSSAASSTCRCRAPRSRASSGPRSAR